MLGGWSGTLTAVTDAYLFPPVPTRSSTVCSQTWLIGSQTGGAFSGTFTQSGANCVDTGTVNGTVTSSGAVSFNFASTAANFCRFVSGDTTYRGVIGTGVTAQRGTVRSECSIGGPAVTRDQTASITMDRR